MDKKLFPHQLALFAAAMATLPLTAPASTEVRPPPPIDCYSSKSRRYRNTAAQFPKNYKSKKDKKRRIAKLSKKRNRS